MAPVEVSWIAWYTGQPSQKGPRRAQFCRPSSLSTRKQPFRVPTRSTVFAIELTSASRYPVPIRLPNPVELIGLLRQSCGGDDGRPGRDRPLAPARDEGAHRGRPARLSRTRQALLL